jgi:hypothetical protein
MLYVGGRLPINEVANSATILHVRQETVGQENSVVETRSDTQHSYVDPEKLQIREELQKVVQPSNVVEEMLPENSYDIQPSDGNREGLLIKEQHSIYGRQPRKKIYEVPDDVRPPVLAQDTEKPSRKKDGVQPLDVNQQRPLPMEAQDSVQLSEVIRHEEPGATIQSLDGKREILQLR